MVLLRKILFPFAIIYGWITSFRNFLFDRGILRSYAFDVPVIAVGNLSVGGTGKTPLIEYLIRLLVPDYKVATLSRGYKRQSAGFVLADKTTDVKILGDEPFQYHQKFPDISVAVDADRKHGIEQLLSGNNRPGIMLLDDAYQHRRVRAGLYLLLTAYGDLYADDLLLPTGNLREGRNGANRAAVIIVTKCPPDLGTAEMEKIRSKLKLRLNQQLFFSFVCYDTHVFSAQESLEVADVRKRDKLLLAGIAKPAPFFSYLLNQNDTVMEFPDHHDFSDKDITDIKSRAKNNIIITTEKDYMRLKGRIADKQLYYLPIKSAFCVDGMKFDNIILDYARGNIYNS